MTYMVVYSSKTGNTQLLAKSIKGILGENCCIYYGKTDEIQTQSADIIFVGFWVYKGSCSEEVKKYLKTVENKKIVLFGTAGFGGSESYYETILAEVKQYISESNNIIDIFMCQGKMPHNVLERYQRLLEDQPEDSNVLDMIYNYKNALSHPNIDDAESVKAFAHRVFNDTAKVASYSL